MLPLLSTCVLMLVSAVVVAARWRFHSEDRSDGLDFPRFSAAIASVIGATIFGLNAFGDELVDPAFARAGLGENTSDLLNSLYLVAACSFFAGQSLTILLKRVPGDRSPDFRLAMLTGCGVIALILIALWWISDASSTPAINPTQFTDPAAMLFSVIFWLVIIVTAAMVFVAAVFGARDHGIHAQLAAMGMAGGVSAVIAAVVLIQLVADHERMATWMTEYGQWWTVPGLFGITVAGLLGMPRRVSSD